MKTFNQPYSELTPSKAVSLLKHGNFRFMNNISLDRNLMQLVTETKDQQTPFAAIFSCMDSRTSAELIFDQSFGDIFSIRIAGNVVSDYVLGSLEYAVAAAGSKLIVVLGHTGCGAIKGACDHVEMGHLTPLLGKISPAVATQTAVAGYGPDGSSQFINAVATIHAINGVKEIMERSQVIKQLVQDGSVGIIPAMYDISTGKVTFFDKHAIPDTIVGASDKQQEPQKVALR